MNIDVYHVVYVKIGEHKCRRINKNSLSLNDGEDGMIGDRRDCLTLDTRSLVVILEGEPHYECMKP